MNVVLQQVSPELPVLIAGPTASGKSALALEIAARQGGVIVNADAIQVYDTWRVLTARPSPGDEAAAPHRLYGHVPGTQAYSAGHWLREVAPLLTDGPRPIIVGGTGLYFAALTDGLVDIPPTPDAVRAKADQRLRDEGREALLSELDATTRARIDVQNPMRVQRAWEVLTTTGRGLADWQAETPPPLLPLVPRQAIIFDVDKDWLNRRIALRFEQMVHSGALDEARAVAPDWDPAQPSSKAIGAAELVAVVRGQMTLEDACTSASIATRQFAKRQRTWFRARMRGWTAYAPPAGGQG